MGRGYSSDRDRSGSGGRDQSAFGHQTPRFEDRSRNRYTTQSRQSHGVAHDDDNGMLIYEEFSGTLGGFGNQTFGSTPDDHYRSWRDRQMAQLDDDYRDYCKTREQQFHSDFDTWRSSRQDQKGSNFGSSTGGDSNLGSAKSTGGASTPTRSGAGTSASKEPETASVGSNRTGNRSPS